jgi:hypothetical protein
MHLPCGPRSRFGSCPDALVKAGFVVLALLCLLASFFSFRSYHSALPTGCDPFGYLYQAEAVREGRLFGPHTERPFLKPLVSELSTTCTREADYAWMIAPHAYHYDTTTGGIVNQYPMGTALVLAAFPQAMRSFAYPVVVTASMLLLTLLAWRERGWKLAAYGAAVVCLASASMVFHPFVEQYRHVGSVALTFALLIGAGWLLRRRPAAALALASASVVFRISNAWLLPLVAMPLIFGEFFSGEALPGLRTLLLRSIKAAGIMLAAGVAWVLGYQWALLGGPLRFTYSPIDRELSRLADMLANARFYLNPLARNWFAVHLLALACLALLFRKGARRWLMLALAICVWNYAFYIAHKVATPYYPCASALILVGLCVSGIGEMKVRTLKFTTLVLGTLSFAAIAALLAVARTPTTSLAAQRLDYENSLGAAQVAWAENASGTFEYALGKPAFRFNWGTNEARVSALRWLAGHGYTQAVLLDDSGIDPDKAFAVLNMTGLRYEVRSDARFGRIAWIAPQP